MSERGHETIDHTADMGIRGWGSTVAEAFEETAAAMLGLGANCVALQPSVTVPLRRRSPDLTGLLVEFLNAIIAEADVGGIVITEVAIDELAEQGGSWLVAATARGIPIAEAADALRIEVKAATLCGACVGRDEDGNWTAQCVVDL